VKALFFSNDILQAYRRPAGKASALNDGTPLTLSLCEFRGVFLSDFAALLHSKNIG
jgi:hypothetical protein